MREIKNTQTLMHASTHTHLMFIHNIGLVCIGYANEKIAECFFTIFL